MWILALHPLAPVAPPQLQALAAKLGLTAFELRPRLQPPGPSVLASYADREAAEAQLRTLEALGQAGFLLGEDAIARERGRVLARSFSLSPEALVAETADGAPHPLPWGEIVLLLEATAIDLHTETQEVQERSFSATRAVVSGGLITSRTRTHTRQTQSQVRQRVLFAYGREGSPLAFPEAHLRYEGLGAEMQASRAANYPRLLAHVRAQAPGALHDARLLTRPAQQRLLGPRLDPEQHLELALAVLRRALLG